MSKKLASGSHTFGLSDDHDLSALRSSVGEALKHDGDPWVPVELDNGDVVHLLIAEGVPVVITEISPDMSFIG